MIRVIVTGSRHASEEHLSVIGAALNRWARRDLGVLAHGAAEGVDTIAAELAQTWGWQVKPVAARWSECDLTVRADRRVLLWKQRVVRHRCPPPPPRPAPRPSPPRPDTRELARLRERVKWLDNRRTVAAVALDLLLAHPAIRHQPVEQIRAYLTGERRRP